MIPQSDFDAVTFDVYGTLLDWEPDIAAFLGRWAKDNGVDAAPDSLLDLYDTLRRPLQDQRPALAYPEILARSLDALAKQFDKRPSADNRQAFSQSAASHPPFPDSAAALRALKDKGFLLGALSNIDDTSFERAMQKAGLAFDIVVTAERVGAYKPDHAHFRTALADLAARGIEKTRILHVAQSRRADIVPANALGLHSVWVNRPGHLFGRTGDGAEKARPDWEVASMAELVQQIG